MAIMTVNNSLIEWYSTLPVEQQYRHQKTLHIEKNIYHFLFAVVITFLCMVNVHATTIQTSPSTSNSSTGDTKTVNITTSGYGETKDVAISNAAREALERAFGVFISSATQISDDEIIKDEITVLSKGFVKTYDVLFENNDASTNTFHVIVDFTLSIQKLSGYATSKGHTVLFDGQSKAQSIVINKKLWQLRKENELKIVKDLLKELSLKGGKCFDYGLIVHDPVETSNNLFKVALEPKIRRKTSFYNLIEDIYKTLYVISSGRKDNDKYYSKLPPTSFYNAGRTESDIVYIYDAPICGPSEMNEIANITVQKLFSKYETFEITEGRCPICHKSGFTSYSNHSQQYRNYQSMVTGRSAGKSRKFNYTNQLHNIIGYCRSSKCGYKLSEETYLDEFNRNVELFKSGAHFIFLNKESVALLEKHLGTKSNIGHLLRPNYYYCENGEPIKEKQRWVTVDSFKGFQGIEKIYTLEDLSKVKEFTIKPIVQTVLNDEDL